MCGIFGCVEQTAGLNTLIKGLKSLEYRGYDSAGLAYINKKKNFVLVKRKGKVAELEKSVNLKNKCNVGIGHTRWATHGGANEINAHPHFSYGQKICLVHNGIIENYQELKEKYLKNIEIKSQTDSEIIAHLLELFEQKDFIKTIKKVCSLIKGSYAFAIINRHHSDKIFLTKIGSPLSFGKSKKGFYFSSDVNTLALFCENFYIMQDGEITELSNNCYKIWNNDRVATQKNMLPFVNNNNTKKEVKCFMQQEITESSRAIKDTMLGFEQQMLGIPCNFFENINSVFLVACGTAFHSCLIGKTFLSKYWKIPIITEIASEFIYNEPVINDKTLCIFVSQSGETADTLLALKLAKKSGAKVLSITNNATSTLFFESEYSLVMKAGWEKAVASTKAYVCQLIMFYLLEKYLENDFDNAKNSTMELVKTIDKFNYKKWAKKVASILPNYDKIIFIGRQQSYVSAMEASLKLKEITYINSIACASGELKHGTLALVDNKTLVIAILNEKELIDKNLSTLKEIDARGGNLLILSPFKELVDYNKNNNLLLPQSDYLESIICIIPLQKMACDLCQDMSLNPDTPKNLSKSVTVE